MDGFEREALKRGNGSDKGATAQWGSYALFEKAKTRNPHNGIFIGAYCADPDDLTDITDSQLAWHCHDKHALTIAETGSGKGRTSVVPTLCDWEGGLYVNDPKEGELASMTAARRGNGSEYAEGLGRPVYVLDADRLSTVNEEYRAKYNPLALITPENAKEGIQRAEIIAQGVVIPDPRADSHWDEKARDWIEGLILYVCTAEHFNDEDRNLATVRKLAIEGDEEILGIINSRIEKKNAKTRTKNEERIEVGLEDQIEPEKSLIDDPQFALIMSMQGLRYPHDRGAPLAFNGEIKSKAIAFEKKLGPNERKSVESTITKSLAFLKNPDIAEMMTIREGDRAVNLRDIREKQATVYVCIKSALKEPRLQRLMTALVGDEVERMGLKTDDKEPQMLMLLDEFPTMGKMELIPHMLGLARGYGLRMWMIAQNLSQINDQYGSIDRFIGGSGLIQFFDPVDKFTTEYISFMLGEIEVSRVEVSTNEGKSSSNSTSKGQSSSSGESTSNSTSEGKAQGFAPGTNFHGDAGAAASALNMFGAGFVETGMNSGESTGSGVSSSSGTSHGTSTGSGSSRGTSTRTAITKNKLLNPDEVRRMLNGDHQNPLSVTFMSGNAFLTRRVKYDQHDHFQMKFDPLAGHKVPLPWKDTKIDRLQNEINRLNGMWLDDLKIIAKSEAYKDAAFENKDIALEYKKIASENKDTAEYWESKYEALKKPTQYNPKPVLEWVAFIAVILLVIPFIGCLGLTLAVAIFEPEADATIGKAFYIYWLYLKWWWSFLTGWFKF